MRILYTILGIACGALIGYIVWLLLNKGNLQYLGNGALIEKSAPKDKFNFQPTPSKSPAVTPSGLEPVYIQVHPYSLGSSPDGSSDSSSDPEKYERIE